jgi:hypothetical protein
MIKYLISLLLFITFQFVSAQSIDKKDIGKSQLFYVDSKNIKISVNNRPTNWTVSPELKPDRLKVFCEKNNNEVLVYSKKDTLRFSVSENDTISFRIILNNKDTAHTDIIGIRKLPNEIDESNKIYYFSQVWSEVKYNFVNIDKLSFSVDSLYRSYLPLVIDSKNDFEYFRILDRFLSSLKDGHSEVYSNQFSAFLDYVPMTVIDFNKKLYITSIRKCPDTDSSWLGAEIIEISGIPTLEFLTDSVFPFISASTLNHLWMQAPSKMLYDLKSKPFVATIKKSNGKVQTITVKRNGESTRKENDESIKYSSKFSNKKVELNYIADNIALLTINTFHPDNKVIENIKSEVLKLTKAKGLIIDIRRNGGGSTRVAHYLQSCITQGKFFLNFGWETRINDGVGKANGNWIKKYESYYLNKAYQYNEPDTIYIPDSIERIKIPVVILIGRYTFSAAEDFLVNIYEVPNRPLLIGEETGGSTGSPLVVPGLPGGGYARICTRRICYPYSSKRFVNEGIKPDIEIKQTFNDFMAGKDIVLEKALESIKDLINQ